MFEQHTIQEAIKTGQDWTPAGIALAAFLFVFLSQKFLHRRTEHKVSTDAAKIYTKLGVLEERVEGQKERLDRMQERMDKRFNGAK